MKNIVKGLTFLLCFFVFACGPASQSEQGSEADQTEETETTTTDTTEEPEEDKSSRPSPPKEAAGQIAGIDIKIDYSSPAVKGRTIWGDLEPYGEVWRTGANEATTIEVSQDVSIEGQTLAAGRYALFTIPNKDKWTVIFNTEADQWGDYNYDEDKDALRVEVVPSALKEQIERLEFMVREGDVALRWDRLEVAFKVGSAG